MTDIFPVLNQDGTDLVGEGALSQSSHSLMVRLPLEDVEEQSHSPLFASLGLQIQILIFCFFGK